MKEEILEADELELAVAKSLFKVDCEIYSFYERDWEIITKFRKMNYIKRAKAVVLTFEDYLNAF